MTAKKILPALLSASLMLSCVHAGAYSQLTAYAKDNITFCTGAAYDKNFGIKTEKINNIKIPKGCTCSIYSPDADSANDTLTSANTKIADVYALHQGMGWVIQAQKTGKTTLNYKKGSDTGKLHVEILPALKLTATKKSAKVSNGRLHLTVKYKNNTKSDIVIEGVDISQSQVLFEGEKEPSKDEVIPSRWIAKRVTIPAGKTKSITVSESVSQTGKIKKFDYPSVYLNYHNVYFSAHINSKKTVEGVRYHGTTSLETVKK